MSSGNDRFDGASTSTTESHITTLDDPEASSQLESSVNDDLFGILLAALTATERAAEEMAAAESDEEVPSTSACYDGPGTEVAALQTEKELEESPPTSQSGYTRTSLATNPRLFRAVAPTPIRRRNFPPDDVPACISKKNRISEPSVDIPEEGEADDSSEELTRPEQAQIFLKLKEGRNVGHCCQARWINITTRCVADKGERWMRARTSDQCALLLDKCGRKCDSLRDELLAVLSVEGDVSVRENAQALARQHFARALEWIAETIEGWATSSPLV